MPKISIRRITIGTFIGVIILVILSYLCLSVDISITFRAGINLEEARMILVEHDISQPSLGWGGERESGYYAVVSVPRVFSIFVINKLRKDAGVENVERGRLFFLPPILPD